MLFYIIKKSKAFLLFLLDVFYSCSMCISFLLFQTLCCVSNSKGEKGKPTQITRAEAATDATRTSSTGQASNWTETSSTSQSSGTFIRLCKIDDNLYKPSRYVRCRLYCAFSIIFLILCNHRLWRASKCRWSIKNIYTRKENWTNFSFPFGCLRSCTSTRPRIRMNWVWTLAISSKSYQKVRPSRFSHRQRHLHFLNAISLRGNSKSCDVVAIKILHARRSFGMVAGSTAGQTRTFAW